MVNAAEIKINPEVLKDRDYLCIIEWEKVYEQ